MPDFYTPCATKMSAKQFSMITSLARMLVVITALYYRLYILVLLTTYLSNIEAKRKFTFCSTDVLYFSPPVVLPGK